MIGPNAAASVAAAPLTDSCGEKKGRGMRGADRWWLQVPKPAQSHPAVPRPKHKGSEGLGTHAAHTRCPCSPVGTGRTRRGSWLRSCSSRCTPKLCVCRGDAGQAWRGEGTYSHTPADARGLLHPGAHLGLPRSWGPASHQRRCTGWAGSRSPCHRGSCRRLRVDSVKVTVRAGRWTPLAGRLLGCRYLRAHP